MYKRQCFVLESKQFQAAKAAASQLELAAQEAGVIEKKKSSQPVRDTETWDDAMVKARGQAERYVRALPASEPNPPFLLLAGCGFDQAPNEMVSSRKSEFFHLCSGQPMV
jgi:hypothetical protein